MTLSRISDAGGVSRTPGALNHQREANTMTVSDRTMAARVALDKARQDHMLALQAALAAGVQATELEQDTQTFARGLRQLLTICTTPSGQGPMVLA